MIYMVFSQLNPMVIGLVVSLFIFAVFRSSSRTKSASWNGRERDYVESLAYGITSQRVLILRDGIIEQEFTASEVHPKLHKRKNAPGFSDIIWGSWQWGQGGGNAGRSRTTAFESLVSANIGIAGVSELIDKNPAFTVNGLKGFYVTRQTAGDAIPLVGNLINIPVSLTRHHVFHDGQRQIYVESTWSRDAPTEGELCEAVISTLNVWACAAGFWTHHYTHSMKIEQ